MPRLHHPSWLLRLAVASAVMCALGIVWFDMPVARYVATHDTHPTAWSNALVTLEYASGFEPWRWVGTTILVLGVIVSRAIPRWHGAAKAWLFVTLTHFVASNAMIWGKHITGRVRPSEWHYGTSWWQHGGAFPSGHIALIGSIALPLAILYPRTRNWMFLVIAFTGCARVMASAHWTSDVFGGIVLVALSTWACAVAVQRAPWPSAA